MTSIRTALRRLMAGDLERVPEVHFHRRGAEPQPCFDERCLLPRL